MQSFDLTSCLQTIKIDLFCHIDSVNKHVQRERMLAKLDTTFISILFPYMLSILK